MLEPAILHKDELEHKFAEHVYDDDMFYYVGYQENWIPEIKIDNNGFQWAIIGNKIKTSECFDASVSDVLGYFSYYVDPINNCVNNFGLYSFDRGNPIVGKDVFDKLQELCEIYHRVEWKMVGGNSCESGYDAAIKRFGGNKVILHDASRDKHGKYHDCAVYEVINNEV